MPCLRIYCCATRVLDEGLVPEPIHAFPAHHFLLPATEADRFSLNDRSWNAHQCGTWQRPYSSTHAKILMGLREQHYVTTFSSSGLAD
eukprot:scaffold152994_cov19-Tisochrysis_lutea.AAC.1